MRNTLSPDLSSSPSKVRVKQLTLDDSSRTEKCPLCQLPLGSAGCNDSHMQRDAEVDPVTYKCRMCKYDTLERKEMEKHLKVHTEEKPPCSSHRPFGANRTSYTTDETATVEKGAILSPFAFSFILHILHTSWQPSFTDCGTSVCIDHSPSSSKKRRKESASDVTGDKIGKCPLCQMQFGSLECLNRHIKANGVTYKSRICEYDMKDRNDIMPHMRVHATELPYSSSRLPYRPALVSLNAGEFI